MHTTSFKLVAAKSCICETSLWQEEIDGLLKENKELKRKTEDLEEQLRATLHPCSVNTAQPDDTRVSPFIMEEWKNKLQAATDACEKIKQDMDKLREVPPTPQQSLCVSVFMKLVSNMLSIRARLFNTELETDEQSIAREAKLAGTTVLRKLWINLDFQCRCRVANLTRRFNFVDVNRLRVVPCQCPRSKNNLPAISSVIYCFIFYILAKTLKYSYCATRGRERPH